MIHCWGLCCSMSPGPEPSIRADHPLGQQKQKSKLHPHHWHNVKPQPRPPIGSGCHNGIWHVFTATTLTGLLWLHTLHPAERKTEEECPIQKSGGGEQKEVCSVLAALAIFTLLTPPSPFVTAVKSDLSCWLIPQNYCSSALQRTILMLSVCYREGKFVLLDEVSLPIMIIRKV